MIVRHSLALALVFSCVASPGAADTSAAPPSNDDTRAHALVERWLQAQNSGAFSDYEKLYAPTFAGVRRSGERVVKLNRKAWLADRARMFKRPQKVTVDELRIDGLRVTFQQTFVQGAYKDKGPKEMLLARMGSELQIAHEEMLSSDKSVDPGPLGRLSITRTEGDGETHYYFLTSEICRSSGKVAGEVNVRATYAAAPAGAKIELTLTACRMASSGWDEPPYTTCSCKDQDVQEIGSVTVDGRAGTGTARHRFTLAELPCGVVARARMRAAGHLLGEVESYEDGGSCPE